MPGPIARRLDELGIRPVAGEFKPLSSTEVDELERRLGSPLPDDYRAFATEFGRCGFDSQIVVMGKGGQEVSVLCMFGAPAPGRSDDVFWHLDTGHQPAGFLAIGDDELGNPLVLNVATGKVFFQDFSSGGAKLVDIADTFADLLDRMTVVPDA